MAMKSLFVVYEWIDEIFEIFLQKHLSGIVFKIEASYPFHTIRPLQLVIDANEQLHLIFKNVIYKASDFHHLQHHILKNIDSSSIIRV